MSSFAVDTSAEALLFTLKKWIDNYMDYEYENGLENSSLGASENLKSLYASNMGQVSVLQNHRPVGPNPILQSLVMELKKRAFLLPESLQDRCDVLRIIALRESKLYLRLESCSDLTFMTDDKKKLQVSKIMVAWRLARAVSAFYARSLTPSPLGEMVRKMNQAAVQYIESSLRDNEPFADPNNLPIDYEAPETCNICQSSIAFTDLWSARCSQNHRFARCGISFIAIQAPKIQKACNICKTAVLSDEFVTEKEMPSKKVTVQLTRGPARARNDSNVGIEDTEDTILNDADSEFEGTDTRMGIGGEDGVDVGGLSVRIRHIAASSKCGTNSPIQARNNLNEVNASQQATAADEDKGTEPAVQSPVTLARVLYLACDVCIYCGGKFMG
jgi:hypothetical protein